MRKFLAERLIASLLTLLLALPASAAPRQQNQATRQAASSGQSSSQAVQSAPAIGTAAAPYEKAVGVTASRPAGAVIAPAKQHRVRRIFIRLGILVGAGAAIGAVALLARASPSRPH